MVPRATCRIVDRSAPQQRYPITGERHGAPPQADANCVREMGPLSWTLRDWPRLHRGAGGGGLLLRCAARRLSSGPPLARVPSRLRSLLPESFRGGSPSAPCSRLSRARPLLRAWIRRRSVSPAEAGAEIRRRNTRSIADRGEDVRPHPARDRAVAVSPRQRGGDNCVASSIRPGKRHATSLRIGVPWQRATAASRAEAARLACSGFRPNRGEAGGLQFSHGNLPRYRGNRAASGP